VNGDAAERVQARLRKRFSADDVDVTPEGDGLRIEVRADGGTLVADIEDESSAILTLLVGRRLPRDRPRGRHPVRAGARPRCPLPRAAG
jgi:hypothetical protein